MAETLGLVKRQWLATIKAGFARAGDDNASLLAAGVAFYMFLAIVPLLAATVLAYGLLASPETIALHIDSLAGMLPGEASSLVREQLGSIVGSSSSQQGLGLIIALGMAFFGARNGAGAMILALNVVFECSEGRSFIKRNIVALTITVVAVGGIALLVGAIALVGTLEPLFPRLPGLAAFAIKALTFAILGLAVAAGAALLYRFAPACGTAPIRWLTPGSLFAALAVVLLSVAFGAYVTSFGSYNATYGSLGAVVVMLTWLWLSSYALLIGAEINVALLRRDDTPDQS